MFEIAQASVEKSAGPERTRRPGFTPFEAKNGRYPFPDPVTGIIPKRGYMRVTNFTKGFDDTTFLEQWKQRNVIVGFAKMALARPTLAHTTSQKSVKANKEALNELVKRSLEYADAYAMADEGTALHKSAEAALPAGRPDAGEARHTGRMTQLMDCLAVNGILMLPGYQECGTISRRYDVGGKFDGIARLRDGSNVIVDWKTGDRLDLSFPSIAAQLKCYEDGVNNGGVWDGFGYDTSVKVRTDFALVVHLPSTRDEVTVYMIDLSAGEQINEANIAVREARKIKPESFVRLFDMQQLILSPAEQDAYWLEQMNAAADHDALVQVAQRSRSFGQWNERLAGQARVIDAELTA